MRRRILLTYLALVAIVLLVLEVPLAITSARRERDAATSAAQRDAISFAALSEEVIEHPEGHDAGALARQFAAQTNGTVVVVDRKGSTIAIGGRAPGGTTRLLAPEAAALDAARRGNGATGTVDSEVYATAPVGTAGETKGAVVVTRSDEATESRIHELWLALLVIAVAVLGFAAFVGDRLARWATSPLRRLDERATALGHGDLGTRADETTGPPEVTQLARTFNTMAARLEELVTNQRQFVADASHQLRSPLTALRLRLESIDPDDPQSAARDIEAAQRETARLSGLVDGLLALARSEGALVERRPIDVTDVVDARVEAWSALAEEQGVSIATAHGNRVEMLLGDGQLEQMLDNLINNAIEVSGPGTRVELRVTQVDGTVEVHVTDQGPGMSAADRARAFETFWQGPRGRRTGAAGLGLPIVARLARANGGTVRLDDAPGGGLDAVVALPIDVAVAPNSDRSPKGR